MSEEKKLYSVLIIDDAFFIRNLIKRAIIGKPENEELGYKFNVIGEAINGKEGIVQYFKSKPDIITLDINMPDINGIEVTRQILSKDPNAKIIVISGNTDEKIKEDILRAGALEYIHKPFENAYLWDRLDKVVRSLINVTEEPQEEVQEEVETVITLKEEPKEEEKEEEIVIEVNKHTNSLLNDIDHKESEEEILLNFKGEDIEPTISVEDEPITISKYGEIENEQHSEKLIEREIKINTYKDIDEDEDDLLSINPLKKETPTSNIHNKKEEDLKTPTSLKEIKFESKQHKAKEEKNKEKKFSIPSPITIVEEEPPAIEIKLEEEIEIKPQEEIKLEIPKADNIQKPYINFDVEFDIDKELPSKESLFIKDNDLDIVLPEEDSQHELKEEKGYKEDESILVIPIKNPNVVKDKPTYNDEEVITINIQNEYNHDGEDEIKIPISRINHPSIRIDENIEVNTAKAKSEELKNNNTKYNTVLNKSDNSNKEDEPNNLSKIAPPRSKALMEMYADVVQEQYNTTFPEDTSKDKEEESKKKEGILSSFKKLFNKK